MLKSLTFTNSQITNLCTWLSKVSLAGKDSRVRTRFINSVSVRLNEIEKSRLDLAQEYAQKDENGKPVIVDKNFQFEPANLVLFVKELNEIMAESYVLDVLESNRQTLLEIKAIILDTEEKFSQADALWYDNVCEIFEKLSAN